MPRSNRRRQSIFSNDWLRTTLVLIGAWIIVVIIFGATEGVTEKQTENVGTAVVLLIYACVILIYQIYQNYKMWNLFFNPKTWKPRQNSSSSSTNEQQQQQQQSNNISSNFSLGFQNRLSMNPSQDYVGIPMNDESPKKRDEHRKSISIARLFEIAGMHYIGLICFGACVYYFDNSQYLNSLATLDGYLVDQCSFNHFDILWIFMYMTSLVGRGVGYSVYFPVKIFSEIYAWLAVGSYFFLWSILAAAFLDIVLSRRDRVRSQ